MSLIEQARDELKRINFGDDDTAAMIDILERFYDQWDSGGAVHAVAPILQRLIAGKCLSPLTGEPDEFVEVTDGVFQNRRCSTVFRSKDWHDGMHAYDLDNPAGSRTPIAFPYWPERAQVRSPVIEI